ncbi:transcriptional regulator [Candidatus Micrarchaeota archaeon]|nr:MAG: transcriptional regulator [Candidatus Micrarchaeota archaeon]
MLGSPSSWRRIPERYGLIGSRCETCKTNYFPSRQICPVCRRRGKIVEKAYTGKGKIYSFTKVNVPPAGFEIEAPYMLAIIELDEGPKLTAQVVDCEERDVKIGLPVRMVFRKIQESGREGLIHYGFKFALSK